jgi:hypothetical protein
MTKRWDASSYFGYCSLSSPFSVCFTVLVYLSWLSCTIFIIRRINYAVLFLFLWIDKITDPKLPSLLKMLLWAQNQLDEKAAYPRIKNLSTAMLEDPAVWAARKFSWKNSLGQDCTCRNWMMEGQNVCASITMTLGSQWSVGCYCFTICSLFILLYSKSLHSRYVYTICLL